jgi:protein phosphatase
VREDNQDAIQIPAPGYDGSNIILAIADGMGGYSHGGIASQLALDSVVRACNTQQGPPGIKTLRNGFNMANTRVLKETERLGAGRMGTTLTVAALVGRRLIIGHVGDTRAYLIRSQKNTLLTEDHSFVGDLVRMKVLSPDKVRTHDRRSILTRSIGIGLFVQPEFYEYNVQEGDWVVLCTDGIWSVVEDDEFSRIAAGANSARSFNQSLVDLALERDSDDNVSVVSAFIHRLPPGKAWASQKKAWDLGLMIRGLWSVK